MVPKALIGGGPGLYAIGMRCSADRGYKVRIAAFLAVFLVLAAPPCHGREALSPLGPLPEISVFKVPAPIVSRDEAYDAGAFRNVPALPITGDWALARLKTYTGEDNNLRAVTRTFPAGSAEYIGRFDLDPSGKGTISGSRNCRPGEAGVSGMPVQLTNTPNLLDRAGSFIYVLNLISNLVNDARCVNSRSVKDSMLVFAHHDWLGRPSAGLYKNLGVFGEGGKSADAECRGLRGYRIVEFPVNKTIACVGYADGAATKLRMLIQPIGEIYVSRADFVRP